MCAVSVLTTWSNYPDVTHRQMEHTDSTEWANDLWVAKGLCLENFKCFVNDFQKMYGDKNRYLNSVTNVMQKF